MIKKNKKIKKKFKKEDVSKRVKTSIFFNLVVINRYSITNSRTKRFFFGR